MIHALSTSRMRLGTGAVRGSGMSYGTTATCSCGEWSYRRNLAPSAGGIASATHAHAEHAATVTLAEEIVALQNLLRRATERVNNAAEDWSTTRLASHGADVAALAAELAAHIGRALAEAEATS